MAVITISRQYGSGGSTIAQLTAEHMGWQLVDNQFVDRVAEELNLPAEEVARRETRRPSLIERLAASLVASTSDAFRMIKQGAVRIDGERVEDRDRVVDAGSTHVYQVGKRRFAKVSLTGDRAMRPH